MAKNTNFTGGFRELQSLVQSRKDFVKYASDGFNSSVPDDDDGTTKPTTGQRDKEMNKAIADSEVTALDPVPDDEDGVFNWSWGTETSESDESGGDVSMTQEDPGTSAPTNAEKASSYSAYSFEENYKRFNKAAAAVRKNGIQPAGPTPAEMRTVKLASLIATADADALLLSRYAVETAAQQANAVKQASASRKPSWTSGRMKVASFMKAAEDMGAMAPDDLAAAEEAFNQLSPEDQEIAGSLLEGLESGEITPDEIMALAQEEAGAGAGAAPLPGGCAPGDPTCDPSAGASMADLGEGSGLSPEEEALLQSLPPEQLEAMDALLQGVAAGEISEDDIAALAEEGARMQEEEQAVNELSSAMSEEGVTPEDLESLNKEGAAELAAHVRNHRNSGRYWYQKAATTKQAQIRNHFREVIRELYR